LLDDGFPACALSLLGELALLELLPAPLPNFTFFNTKPPPALLELAELDGVLAELLEVSLLDDPPARCRHPVMLVVPAVEPVDDCGVDAVGLCAASVPHSATAVLSVTAHCH
jgi:hypothetical protein